MRKFAISCCESVENAFGPGKVFKCGGHVGRAHANNLKDMAKQKVFSAQQTAIHKTKFPEVESAKCECKCHSQTCGCLSETFIKSARINHFCCLQQCKTENMPEECEPLERSTARTSINGRVENVASITLSHVPVAIVMKTTLNVVETPSRPRMFSSANSTILHTEWNANEEL